MAGTNGKPKFLRCNREDEVEDLKIRGTLFEYIPSQVVATNVVTAAQWMQPLLTLTNPGPITGPSALALFTEFAQQAPPVVGETGNMVLSNPTAAPIVVNLGAGWTPASITIPPNSQYEIAYRLTSTNPIAWEIFSIVAAGAVPPSGTLPSGTFGSDFALVPSQPYDVIVRNAANTMWVPSNTANGGRMPWLQLNGVASPQQNGFELNDFAPTGSTNYSEMNNVVNTQTQAAVNDFALYRAESAAPGFGARGGATKDSLYKGVIDSPVPGIQANSYFLNYHVVGGPDLFYVRSSGVTHVTLAAGPPVTPIAINAAGEFCADVSSALLKENIIDATNTSVVNTLNVREFNFIGDNIKQVGAIAQEVEPLIPAPLRPAFINYKPTFSYTDAQGVFHPMTRDLTQPQSLNLQSFLFATIEELQKLRERVALLEGP